MQTTPIDSLAALRGYLDNIGFNNLYRYIVSFRSFHSFPLSVNARTRLAVALRDTWVEGDARGRRLAWALMAVEPVPLAELTDGERALADKLVNLALLHRDGETIAPGRLQLICVGDVYLFIDAAIGELDGPAHEVYIGADTLLLLYYLDATRFRGARVLDLGTGTGVVGSTAARAGARVMSTDIDESSLWLAGVNGTLNDLDVDVVGEDMLETIARDETWDVIACNPPYIAVPPEFEIPTFARGPGRDGLDMMRALLGCLDDRLSDRGFAAFVADILGDRDGPFLRPELEQLAETFAVEVYIDQRHAAADHAAALTAAYPEPVRIRMREYLLDELGATDVYMTVICVRRGDPGLLVCNRFRKA